MRSMGWGSMNEGQRRLEKAFSQAVALHGAGRHGEAEAIYRRLLEQVPGNVNLLVNYGLLLRDAGRHAEAIELLRRATKRAPDNSTAHLALGAACEAAGDLDGAAAAFGRAIVLDPTDARAWNNQGKILHLRGENDRALACLQRAVTLQPDYPVALANLGVVLHALDRHDEAVACFERARRLRPDDTAILYNLAGALAVAGRRQQAVDCFRQLLERDPDHAPARHMLAALTGQTPAGAPRRYVETVFDQYASRFEAHITGVLGYAAPAELRCLAGELGGRRFPLAVDLGCGTGLAGRAFRDAVDRLWGVDLSAAMLEQARRKAIYDHLEQADIVEFLVDRHRHGDRFDLVLAADVLIYQGDLQPLFAAVAGVLATDGLFLFSIETATEENGHDYLLRPSGRFAHRPAYVEDLARHYDFEVAAHRGIPLRKEQGSWLAGMLFCLRRS